MSHEFSEPMFDVHGQRCYFMYLSHDMYKSHELCIVFTKRIWVILCIHKTYTSHKLCISVKCAWVINYVYHSNVHESRTKYMCHEQCIWDTCDVHESQSECVKPTMYVSHRLYLCVYKSRHTCTMYMSQMYMNHKLCMWVTNNVYGSHIMYMSLRVSVWNEICIFVTDYVYVCMSHDAHEQCV